MPRRRRKNPRLPQRGQPSAGDHYYLMLSNGMLGLFPWNDTDFDQEAWNFGNCFNTHAQAEQTRDKITEVVLPLHEEQR